MKLFEAKRWPFPMSLDIVRDPSVPAVIWSRLTDEDKTEYLRLKLQFHQSQRSAGKDSRMSVFHHELHTAFTFIGRRSTGREERSIVCGVGFAGQFICVNTRQLKAFLGRCKSSINGGFLQMGYVAVSSKTKARKCLLAVLHSLVDDQTNLRQWTVRSVSDTALFCMASSFPDSDKPVILEGDLTASRQSLRPVVQGMVQRTFPLFSTLDEIELPTIRDDDFIPSWNLGKFEPVMDNEWTIKLGNDPLLSFADFGL
jgi:hypothetical protein